MLFRTCVERLMIFYNNWTNSERMNITGQRVWLARVNDWMTMLSPAGWSSRTSRATTTRWRSATSPRTPWWRTRRTTGRSAGSRGTGFAAPPLEAAATTSVSPRGESGSFKLRVDLIFNWFTVWCFGNVYTVLPDNNGNSEKARKKGILCTA